MLSLDDHRLNKTMSKLRLQLV